MSITNRLFFAFTLLLFSLEFANAKAISFTASAPTEVARNQVFELFYTLKGGSSGGLNDKIKVDKAVDVIYGPIRKDLATVEIIDGKRTGVIKESYKYKLRILEEGTFTIPGLAIEVDGVKYISNSIEINVISPDQVKKKATFSARLSPEEVTQNRLFKLIYKLEGAKGNDLKTPPSVAAFKYLSDPSIVIDSVPVYTETYTYLLEAIEPGTYILPSATILADGELLTSSTLKLTIETKDLVVRENGDGGFISMVQLIISKLNTYYSLGFIILIGPVSIYCLYRGRTKKKVRWAISGAILLSIIIQFILLCVVAYIIVSLIK